MQRPSELFDREHEWRDLGDFVTRHGPGTRIGIVRGRRRQGKSYLLRRLAHAARGFYYQAVEEDSSQALAGFGRALGEHLGVPGGRLALDTWDDTLGALSDMPNDAGPRLVVIDEFPCLLHHSPELPSLLQRFVGDTRCRPTMGRDHTGSSQVLALGGAKLTDARRTVGDLTRLERIRS